MSLPRQGIRARQSGTIIRKKPAARNGPRRSRGVMTHTDNADQPVGLCAEQRVVAGTRVVSLRGQLDYDAKDQLSQALSTQGDVERPRIVADLSGVSFMDSSGINVFVATHQQVSGAGGWVRIAAARQPVLRVLQLVGVDTLIPCHPTVEQALAD